ncbi:hypothetical protein [Mucilaginibacter pedocola]|uniref:Signal peptidase n=1 Tax=Mucilaginibacter pedocola TaxID=1792845 RepID=A0A1S9PBS0_9SPHI|nr:hypothetical protein [Mucilaginibacter pedocola]OOQ58247.1 hypothetical protein BC343_11435 [Mucilaginibacter pedocola]
MWKRLCALIAVLVLGTFNNLVLAQCNEVPNPGDPDDPGYDPNGCPVPLDTWVIVLVVAAFAYGYYNLNKKQKALMA